MGLNFNATRCLFYAKSIGVDFEKTAMLGRQILYTTEKQFRENFDAYGYEVNDGSIKNMLKINNGYSEEFFKILGAKTIDSFDNSEYENATQIHNFNEPIPDKFKGKYSVVFDGGSLEHIFNISGAIKNCMEMIKEDGHFIAITPANNWMGHGFYQFSPELFFRAFNTENGFEIKAMLIYERDRKSSFYIIEDPAVAGERVTLTNCSRSLLFVVAQKISDKGLSFSIPMQTDYIERWNKGKTSLQDVLTSKPPNRLRTGVVMLLINLIKLISANEGYDPRFFKKINI